MTVLNMSLYVSIKVWDKDGRIIRSVYEESHSLVQAWLAQLLANMGFITLSGTHNDIGGSARTITSSTSANLVAYRSVGAVNDATEGIVIGTGSTAVDITDSKLVAQIAEGTSSGQMTHQVQTYPANITISDPDATFAINRNFTNNSGGQITVAEIGIYARLTHTVNTEGDFCIVRDVPASVDVPNGGGCNVAYSFKISE